MNTTIFRDWRVLHIMSRAPILDCLASILPPNRNFLLQTSQLEWRRLSTLTML